MVTSGAGDPGILFVKVKAVTLAMSTIPNIPPPLQPAAGHGAVGFVRIGGEGEVLVVERGDDRDQLDVGRAAEADRPLAAGRGDGDGVLLVFADLQLAVEVDRRPVDNCDRAGVSDSFRHDFPPAVRTLRK